MNRFLKTAAAALLLALLPFAAQAAVVTNVTDQLFNAVDELSSELTVPAGTTLTVFISGTYENLNVVVLQRERGSPGSGAWEDVLTVTEVSVGAGTVADARLSKTFITGTSRENYRLNMTATGTGAVVAYLTDHPTAARTWVTNATQISLFDDFDGPLNDGSLTVINPSLYISTQGGDSAGTIGAITVAIQEGGLTLVSGGAEAGSSICLSTVDEATSGALVSDGTMVVEVRYRTDIVTGLTYIGLQDENCTAAATADEFVDIDSGVVTQTNGGTDADIVAIARQDEATDTDDWQAFSAIGGVEGANALEVPLGTQTVADTYVVLRVEIDSAGNAYFYVAGLLVHAEPLAVATTARLIPMALVAETAAAGGPVTAVLDYLQFVVPRPPT